MKKALLTVILCLLPMFCMAQEYVVVSGTNVCLHSKPRSYSKLDGADKPHFNTGDKLECRGIVGSYYQVKYNGFIYYIPTKFAGPSAGQSSNVAAPRLVVVAADDVCLRYEANEESKLTGPFSPSFKTGDTLTCVGIEGNYYKIKYGGEFYYYIPLSSATPKK